MNDKLYGLMQLCLSSNHNFYRLKQFTPHGMSALIYLYHIIENAKTDWIVNCDEDCFITNEAAIENLIQFMQANNYAYCGMPEGGVCPHRNYSWETVNPFFNIFNAKAIRHLLQRSNKAEIEKTRYDPYKTQGHLVLCPINHANVNHVNFEVFSCFFYWLSQNFRGLYLNCQTHHDGISTILLDLHNRPFAQHSWYSREFNGTHHQRILNLYNEAKVNVN